MPDTPEARARLPKWAQDRIKYLERDLQHWKDKYTAGNENTNTFAGGFPESGNDFGIPAKRLENNEHIWFHLGGDDWISCQVAYGKLHVMASGRGRHTLHVLPSSSNVVNIVVEND